MSLSPSEQRKIKVMKAYDLIRTIMVRNRAPAKDINVISEAFLTMRKDLRWDQIQESIRSDPEYAGK